MEDLFGVNYRKVLAEHGPDYASKFIRAAKSLKYLNKTYGITLVHLKAQQSNLDSIWSFQELNYKYLEDVNLIHWGPTTHEQDKELFNSPHFKVIEHFVELLNVTDYSFSFYNESELRNFYIAIDISNNNAINIIADWEVVITKNNEREFKLC